MSILTKFSVSSLKSGVSRFKKDERGVTAVTFGIVAVMLTSGIGASVEISRSIAAKNALQLAVDAAVLQAKRREMDQAVKVGLTAARAQGKIAGEKIFWANMEDTKGHFKSGTLAVDIQFNADTGEAKAVGTGEIEQLFTGMFGVGPIKLASQAEATWSNQTPVELALVLDSTPSMFSKDGRPESRFTLLRNASKNFTNTLFNAVQDPSKELLRVAVVPWATTVNIRSQVPADINLGAYTSPPGIEDPGSQIPITGQIDRSSKVNIVDDFAPVGWRGCISGSNEPPTTYTDAMPATKWTALFTPQAYDSDWDRVTNLRVQSACVSTTYWKSTQSLSGVDNLYIKTPTQMTIRSSGGSTCQTLASSLITQQPCVSDPNELDWNTAKGDAGWCPWKPKFAWKSNQQITGPNVGCPHPILGLSPNRTQVMETLDRMAPVYGNTHADVGLRWGLRVLAPDSAWKDFFKVKNPIAPYAKDGVDTTTKKYMVLITDGENVQNNWFPGYWGCAGTAPGCTGAPSSTEIDTRMMGWCNAIKNDYKITLITIAVNVTNASAVTLLRNCAGKKPDGSSYAYTVDANDLDRAMQEIAIGVANNLRLKS